MKKEQLRTPLEGWIAEKIGVAPQKLTRKAIEDYQLSQIRNTIAWVKKKSAFYQKQLASIDPAAVTSLEHVSRLPFTCPQDIENNPQQFVCLGQREIERIVTLQSSGTTGNPKRIFFTKEDQELTIDFFDIGMRNLVDPSDRVMILLPWELPGSVGDLLRSGLKRLGAEPLPFGPVFDAGRAVLAAVKEEATSMVGIPSHLLAMARHQNGRALKGQIKTVLLSTDYVPAAICRVLENTWGCTVFNHYGMTEMGLGGGVQCRALAGYHLREADLYFEIVDPDTGELLPEGETGEIVFTTLTRDGMPLIRYRTGDLSKFLPEPCPCGTVLRSLDIVRERISGCYAIGGHRLSISMLDELLFPLPGVLDYQATILNLPGRGNSQGRDSGPSFLHLDIKMAEHERAACCEGACCGGAYLDGAYPESAYPEAVSPEGTGHEAVCPEGAGPESAGHESACPEEGLRERILQVLRTIPAIERQFPKQDQIRISFCGSAVPFSRGTGKRKIILK